MTVAGDSSLNTLYVDGTTTVNGDIVPTSSGTINLGSADKPFGGLYISNNTIHFAGSNNADSAAMSFADGQLGLSSQGTDQTFLASVNGKLGVGKGSSANSTLDVDGTTAISGATALASTLAVTGATTLSSTLAVSGDATMGGTLVLPEQPLYLLPESAAMLLWVYFGCDWRCYYGWHSWSYQQCYCWRYLV